MASSAKSYRPNANRYRVVFQHEAALTSTAVPTWSIEEAEIQLQEDSDDDDTLLTSKSRVPFQAQVRSSSATVPTALQQPSAKEIHDLCLALKQLKLPQSSCDTCLGYISDASQKRRLSLYWPEKPLVDKSSSSTLSLAEILNDQTKHKLGESDKRFMALALASGMLRLYSTPWLAQQWGKKDIVLLTRGGGIIAGHLFISAAISGLAAQSQVAGTPYFTPCRPIKEQTLFALGIVLIELAMEKPFENLAVAEDLNPDGTKHSSSDFYTADRLVDEVYVKAGERYGNAVRRCIRCEFDQRKSSLDDPAFRRKVYEGVVAELESEVRDLMRL